MVPSGGGVAAHHVHLPDVRRHGVGIVVAVDFLHRVHLLFFAGNGTNQVVFGHRVEGRVGIVGG